jgi:hypothetical protein
MAADRQYYSLFARSDKEEDPTGLLLMCIGLPYHN